MNNSKYINWLLKGFAYFALSALLAIAINLFAYKWVNPSPTWLMVQRYFIHPKTQFIEPKQQWVAIGNISPFMVQAAVAAEDNLFMDHWGFDFESIKKARDNNITGSRTRGASTISMQTAKNVFLWPKRSWTRKALEAFFTVLIEVAWGKERIMEVYLNVAEMGIAIYGAEAAANHHFKRTASAISRNQAALLAAALPNPLTRNPQRPSAYLKSYQNRILRNMNNIGPIDLTPAEPGKKQSGANKE